MIVALAIVLAVACCALTALVFVVGILAAEVRRLERDSHPPVDMLPAMVETLKWLKVICPHPPEGWRCTRPVGHHGPCAAENIS